MRCFGPLGLSRNGRLLRKTRMRRRVHRLGQRNAFVWQPWPQPRADDHAAAQQRQARTMDGKKCPRARYAFELFPVLACQRAAVFTACCVTAQPIRQEASLGAKHLERYAFNSYKGIKNMDQKAKRSIFLDHHAKTLSGGGSVADLAAQ